METAPKTPPSFKGSLHGTTGLPILKGMKLDGHVACTFLGNCFQKKYSALFGLVSYNGSG